MKGQGGPPASGSAERQPFGGPIRTLPALSTHSCAFNSSNMTFLQQHKSSTRETRASRPGLGTEARGHPPSRTGLENFDTRRLASLGLPFPHISGDFICFHSNLYLRGRLVEPPKLPVLLMGVRTPRSCLPGDLIRKWLLPSKNVSDKSKVHRKLSFVSWDSRWGGIAVCDLWDGSSAGRLMRGRVHGD